MSTVRAKSLQEIPTTTKWSTRKKIIVGSVIAAVVIAIIIIAVVLGVTLSRKDATSSTSSSQSSPTISIYWSLDGTTSDSTGIYNGTLMNSASYFTTTTNQPYVAYGRGLTLTASLRQYMRVLTPYIDLTSKSLTIEAWIFSSTVYSSDSGIFSQCQCSTCANQCLFFIVRGSRLCAGFTFNDITGSQNITNNAWYHVAFVYNADTKQQILYVNGVQDAIKSDASSYQGVNGTIDIGSSVVFSIRNYFNGYIDNVKLTTRAKTATELLTAATLTGYFPFDIGSPYNDAGPNGLNGTANNAIIVSGRVNQAIRFSGTSSNFQAYGFFQIGYGVYPNRPFSISLWINPSSTGAAAIVQLAYSLTTGACYNIIGVWTTIGLTGQLTATSNFGPYIIGPFVSIGTWMHVSLTYSVTRGYSLYINGVLFGNTGGFTMTASGSIMYLQLGYVNSCTAYIVSNNAFQGSIDEVYVHSRELTQAEVTGLANP